MVKILFLIHDLGQGGAEKVLINLVNNMDFTKFEISVLAMFGGGINEQFLSPEIRYKSIFSKAFPGNSHIMKMFSPKLLHKLFIRDTYDIEISFLEGPTARIVSGCKNADTKLVTWVHCTMNSQSEIRKSFRNIKEAEACYNMMDKIVFVSEGVGQAFLGNCNYKGATEVIYNPVDYDKILEMSKEEAIELDKSKIGLIAVGTLKHVKGYDRMLRIIKIIHEEGYPVHLYILGVGPQQKELEKYIAENSLGDTVSLLGYKTNPYKYVSKSSLFVCASYSEGFSTAVMEALIVGTAVCAVDVSGMKELLGENNEFGVVTANTEDALYQGIKQLVCNSEKLSYYRNQAKNRGKKFAMENTIDTVESFLESLIE